jgi:hypothetical protein
LTRRALQLGLRGEALRRFGYEEILELLDISDFVAAQRPLATLDRRAELLTPVEDPMIPQAEITRARLGLDAPFGC